MLDIKQLRQSPEFVVQKLAERGYAFDSQLFEELEKHRSECQQQTQQLQAERNRLSKLIGIAKSTGENAESLLQQASQLGQQLQDAEAATVVVEERWQQFLSQLPNVPNQSVPVGKSEADNQEVRRWGMPREMIHPKDHVDLALARHLFDPDAAAHLSGARFMVLYGDLAHLHRALIQFMLDLHTQQHGYRETYVPYMVESACLYGTGQLSKFKDKDDFFVVQGAGREWILIPTAEVPLTNLVRDKILPAAELPLKWVAHTPCFRSEAGSYGQDTRGLIRQHQFEKVELVQVVHPDQSYFALEELTHHAEVVLQQLELPYRVLNLCTGDMGFSAAKTYDLEVWLPGQGRYREISSCSNCEAFQARRLKARWKSSENGKNEWVHTLNGSGVAVGRALLAVLENYQDEGGKIAIPSVLQPYMGGKTHL